jgi:hypothetical protein
VARRGVGHRGRAVLLGRAPSLARSAAHPFLAARRRAWRGPRRCSAGAGKYASTGCGAARSVSGLGAARGRGWAGSASGGTVWGSREVRRTDGRVGPLHKREKRGEETSRGRQRPTGRRQGARANVPNGLLGLG